MFKNLYSGIFTTSLIIILIAVPLLAATEEDPCREEDIMVRNATMIDLWYKKKSGECFIWTHEHLFTIKLGDSIDIFSDLNCRTFYCANNPNYKDYKSVDAIGNCRVKILPKCNLSDM
jgi:hypothetical protein